MQKHTYLFTGDRAYVLNRMIELGLNVPHIFVQPGSYLEKELTERQIPFETNTDKEALINRISNLDFDILISNGCRTIFPVSKIKKAHQTFVNIHPAYLPDLKGINPVNGALLFGHDAGATCHIMDDGIDTGPIISRINIPLTDDLDIGLLYQLCFMGEVEVFNEAFNRSFVPLDPQPNDVDDPIYYTMKPEDMTIDLTESVDKIISRIKAFGLTSQGARLTHRNNDYKVLNAEIVSNPFLMSKIDNYQDLEVVFRYEQTLVIRKGDTFLKLQHIDGDLSTIQVGDNLA